MFHKAIKLEFGEDAIFKVTFQNGAIKSYDMAAIFHKYPQLEALKDRKLFLSGKLFGHYGIRWNDDLDIEVETIYQDGIDIGVAELPVCLRVGNVLCEARLKAGLSQAELSLRTGIDQSDISKLERGVGNPSIVTLEKIAAALGTRLEIRFLPE